MQNGKVETKSGLSYKNQDGYFVSLSAHKFISASSADGKIISTIVNNYIHLIYNKNLKLVISRENDLKPIPTSLEYVGSLGANQLARYT